MHNSHKSNKEPFLISMNSASVGECKPFEQKELDDLDEPYSDIYSFPALVYAINYRRYLTNKKSRSIISKALKYLCGCIK